MHPTPRLLLSFALPLASAAVAHAHPGHDGHELTWEFGHLIAHPWATLACGAVVSVAIWAGWRAARAAVQSFRGSQPRRGK